MLATALMGLLFMGCVVLAAVTAFADLSDGERQRVGPLSEWIPGTVTALSLTYALYAQRRISLDRQRTERERLELERTAVAKRVFAWLAIEPGATSGKVVWSNMNDCPIFACLATVHMEDGSVREISCGTIPPHQRAWEQPTGKLVTLRETLATTNGPSWLTATFQDIHGTFWERGAFGDLARLDWGDQVKEAQPSGAEH